MKDADRANSAEVVAMASPLTRASNEVKLKAKGGAQLQPQVTNEGGALSSSADGF